MEDKSQNGGDKNKQEDSINKREVIIIIIKIKIKMEMEMENKDRGLIKIKDIKTDKIIIVRDIKIEAKTCKPVQEDNKHFNGEKIIKIIVDFREKTNLIEIVILINQKTVKIILYKLFIF